jgi:hypothetical protein
LSAITHANGNHLDSKRRRDRLRCVEERNVNPCVRVQEHRDPVHVGRGLLEQPYKFAGNRQFEILETGNIGAWSRLGIRSLAPLARNPALQRRPLN